MSPPLRKYNVHIVTIYSLNLFTELHQLPVREPINHRPPGATIPHRDLYRRIGCLFFFSFGPYLKELSLLDSRLK